MIENLISNLQGVFLQLVEVAKNVLGNESGIAGVIGQLSSDVF